MTLIIFDHFSGNTISMDVFFTICSNNYLAQATVLSHSIRKFHPETPLIIFLCDKKITSIDYSLMAAEVIEMESMEPRFHELVLKYNIIELNSNLRPRAFEFLLSERNLHHVVYLDPDIRLFQPLDFLKQELSHYDVLLTPHIYSPIPPDGKKPDEQSFLMFGIYNLGFLSVKRSDETLRFLHWWKSRTFDFGHMDTYKGAYVDQLPMNHAPIFFKSVGILEDPGINMAPWNLHERTLQKLNGIWIVNAEYRLKFYHFSSFKMTPVELPLAYYNRFSLKDRPDLQEIYNEYQEDLISAGYDKYRQIPNVYNGKRKEHIRKTKRKKWLTRFLP